MAAAEDRHEHARAITPFVPRLTIEWLREHPERRWQVVDGTLAFVDISGFTAMSERLARLGRVGGEEVTDVMNGVFAALLEQAYAFGGGLLKFGGDALLLLYDGEDHAARAVAAAYELRRTLRALGRPRTSAGPVTLRMHAGIHSGPLHFFLLGESHRELLLAGPGASRTVEMEAASEAGEILVSAETAAALGGRGLGESKGGGFLVRSAPRVRPEPAPLPDVGGLPLESAVPRAVRAELTQGPLEGEHRHAAVGFVRFSGTDAALVQDGPAATAERLEVLVRTIQAAADRHDVTFLESDVDLDGGRIVLVAGAPQSHTDDEERLLRTLRAIVESAPPFPVGAGASRGGVFAGGVGAPFRRTYTILGDTAATAARLMARAPAGEIFVQADAVERVAARFAATQLEPLRVKGKSEPLRAVSLGPLLESAAEAAPARRLPFVDRERERAVLGASVAPVRAGFGTLVELIGEPGIGKSRLADELRELCADMTTLTLACDQYAATTPYHPFRALLRSLLGLDLDGDPAANAAALAGRLAELDSELVPWAPLLAVPLDVEVESTPEVDELDEAFRRARLHGVVSAALERLLDAPTLLVAEDVHWMDDASSDLLRHIGTRLPTKPWLLGTTRRPGGGGFLAAEGTPPLPAFTLRLEPLPEADARALVEAAAGGRALRGEEIAAIAERGGGNPLFLQELAAASDTRLEAQELPENVEALVAARIDNLAPADRALLRWASVLGGSFPAALVATVLADDSSASSDSAAWDRLSEFVERDPEVAGGFRFRHVLIRDAAYEGLSYRRRRELHGRVAEVLERQAGAAAEEEAELLSLHFFRAGRPAETWRYSVAAGRRAQAKWANVEAIEFYRRALDAASGVPGLAADEVAAVWEALAEGLQLVGDLSEAARALGNARRLRPKEAPEQVVLMRKEGALREAMGKYSDALRWYGRALKAAELVEDDLLRRRRTLRLQLDIAEVRFRQGAFRECIRRCHEVADAALELGAEDVLAAAYVILHTVYTFLGLPERAAYDGLALPLYEELGDLKGQALALNNLGVVAYYEGEWGKALDVYARSRALFERIGDVTSVAMAMNNVAEILSDQGRLEEAAELFDEVQRICDEAGQRLFAAVARGNRGRVAARAGRLAAAETLLREALASFETMSATSFVLETETRLAEVAVLDGARADEAVRRTTAVLEQAADAADVAAARAAALRLRAAARLQRGEPDAAHDDLAASLEIARAAGARYELAATLDLLAATDAAAEAARERDVLFEQLGIVTVVRAPRPT